MHRNIELKNTTAEHFYKLLKKKEKKKLEIDIQDITR